MILLEPGPGVLQTEKGIGTDAREGKERGKTNEQELSELSVGLSLFPSVCPSVRWFNKLKLPTPSRSKEGRREGGSPLGGPNITRLLPNPLRFPVYYTWTQGV